MINDPFRAADNWTDCPRCEGSLGWNLEDGLDGQLCSCGYVFCAEDDPEVATLAATEFAIGPRHRVSPLAIAAAASRRSERLALV
jgi:hypothetical protein